MSRVLDGTRNCAEVLGEVFAAVYQRVESWRPPLCAILSAGAPSVRALDDLVESLVVPALSSEGSLIVGAGFVATPGLLAEAPWHLSWWLGPSIRPLRATEDPRAISFRDYTLLEWWRVPASSRLPHLTGPYVDYLCTDEYTLTLTVPVEVDGQLLGVVGADLAVVDVERMLLPTLRELGGSATLVNQSARVVVSTDAHRATGSLYRVVGLDTTVKALEAHPALATVWPVAWGGTSLALVTDPSERIVGIRTTPGRHLAAS